MNTIKTILHLHDQFDVREKASIKEAESTRDAKEQDRWLSKAEAYGECRTLAGQLAASLIKEVEAEDRLALGRGTCGDMVATDGLSQITKQGD